VVPLPGRTAFYTLVDRLATGKHTFDSAVTRRQTANRPAGAFTPTFTSRPGDQVQIDSTPIDVMVLLDNGLPARFGGHRQPFVTAVVDLAPRTIPRTVLGEPAARHRRAPRPHRALRRMCSTSPALRAVSCVVVLARGRGQTRRFA
jgi:hypothetical protein